MAWWVDKDTGDLKKAASSPGAQWLQIPGAPDSDTRDQAAQQLAQDIANGDFGESVGNGIKKAINDATGGALTSFSSVANALSAFYAEVTNGKMWRSLGWLLLGVILMFAGILMLIGRRSPAAAATGLLG